MKKLKKLLVAVPLALTSVAALAGCADTHEHSLKLTGAIDATCSVAGNTAYYTCETCGKHYSDEAAANEIVENSWVVPAKGHLYLNEQDHDCNRGCGTIRETVAYNYWDGTVATALPNEVDGVITISTAEQLAKLAAMVNAGQTFEGVVFKLACDIDLKNIEWTPIGCGSSTSDDIIEDYAHEFRGIFDGDGHTIYNLKITEFDGGAENTSSSRGVGLFGLLVDAEVKNFTIENAEVVGNHYVGTAVGYTHGSQVSNIVVKNSQVTGAWGDSEENGDKTGGIVGYLATVSSMSDCFIEDSSVKAVRDCALVAGWKSETSTVTNCAATDTTVAHYEDVNTPSDYLKDGNNITNDLYNA